MNIRKTLPFLACALALSLVSLKSAYEEYSYNQSLTTQNLKSLQAELKFNAGRLRLSSHNQNSLDFKSVFTKENWRPELTSDVKTSNGKVSITQPEEKNTNMKDRDKNEWNVTLPRSLATDLKLSMGAGEGTVDLSGTNLNRMTMEAGAGDFKVNLANTSVQNLELSAGVGAMKLDLSGKRTANLKADISAGIGDLKIILPRDVGVRVQISGIGGVKKTGFTKQNGYYVNEAYGKTKHVMDIDVSAGLGGVELILEGKGN
jgi:predicted membrane protein